MTSATDARLEDFARGVPFFTRSIDLTCEENQVPETGLSIKIKIRTLAVAACLGLGLTALPAHSCSRTPTAVDRFVDTLKRYPTFVQPVGFGQPVIFRGVVESVAKLPPKSHAKTAKDARQYWGIQFKAVHWYGSNQQAEQATVLTPVEPTEMEIFCGIRPFVAKAGEEWLVFAYREKDGQFSPDTDVSLRIQNGQIPPEILRQLP